MSKPRPALFKWRHFEPTGRVERCIVSSASEVLRRGPDDDLVDFHVGWLLDGVSDCARDRVGRNGHFHKLAQILSGYLLRAALRKLRGNSTWRDHCAPDILGMQFHPEP